MLEILRRFQEPKYKCLLLVKIMFHIRGQCLINLNKLLNSEGQLVTFNSSEPDEFGFCFWIIWRTMEWFYPLLLPHGQHSLHWVIMPVPMFLSAGVMWRVMRLAALGALEWNVVLATHFKADTAGCKSALVSNLDPTCPGSVSFWVLTSDMLKVTTLSRDLAFYPRLAIALWRGAFRKDDRAVKFTFH